MLGLVSVLYQKLVCRNLYKWMLFCVQLKKCRADECVNSDCSSWVNIKWCCGSEAHFILVMYRYSYSDSLYCRCLSQKMVIGVVLKLFSCAGGCTAGVRDGTGLKYSGSENKPDWQEWQPTRLHTAGLPEGHLWEHYCRHPHHQGESGDLVGKTEPPRKIHFFITLATTVSSNTYKCLHIRGSAEAILKEICIIENLLQVFIIVQINLQHICGRNYDFIVT